MKYFYYYRNILGKWCPCLSNRIPTRSVEGSRLKLLRDPVELHEEQQSWTLDQCIAAWPVEP